MTKVSKEQRAKLRTAISNASLWPRQFQNICANLLNDLEAAERRLKACETKRLEQHMKTRKRHE